MAPSRRELVAILSVLRGEPLNGKADALAAPMKRFVEHLAAAPEPSRTDVLGGWLALQCDPDSVQAELETLAAGGTREPPEDAPPDRCATLADVKTIIASLEWPWPGWLAAGSLNALASDPGIGKTILAAELARRVYRGEPWPCGAPPSFPPKTPTIWIPGDRHFQQLLMLAENFGIPPEAILFNSLPSDPVAGLDLDDATQLVFLEDNIGRHRPAFIVVDTVGMTTSRNLCKPEDARAYFGPLADVAQRTSTPILLLTHLSKDNQALGRRIVGACRTVWKLTRPDPEGQPDRRKATVDKSYLQAPPALGMTIATTGCSFDTNPPSEPRDSSPGRPPETRDAAVEFIKNGLAHGDRKQVDLVNAWVAQGQSKSAIFRAFDALKGDGTIVIDDAKSPKIVHLARYG